MKTIQFDARGLWVAVSVIGKRRGSTRHYLVQPDGKSVGTIINSGVAVKLANAMNGNKVPAIARVWFPVHPKS